MEEKDILARIEALEERLGRIENLLSRPQSMPPRQSYPKPPQKTQIKLPSSGDLEAKIGGTLLNRIAIVAILIGVSFFLKYAFDHQWIGPTGRIVIGIICGLALLCGGEYFQKKKYPIFAQGLSGGGTAVLYFSIFAAFQFYHLLPQWLAFAIMVLITAEAVALALRYSAEAIAILGIIGGFCTPFLLSDGSANYVVLFSYNIVLNLGILTIAYFRDWRILKYLSFVLTYITFAVGVNAAWGNKPNVWALEAFLSGFFVIYTLVAVMYHIVNKKVSNPFDFALNLLNAVIYFGFTYALLVDKIGDYMGYYAAGLGAYYLFLGYLAWKMHQNDKFTALAFWGLTIGFITLAIPLQLKGSWISLSWAVESIVILWLGLKRNHLITRMLGLIVLLLVGCNLVYGQVPHFDGVTFVTQKALPFVNWLSLDYLSFIAACFLVTWLYRRFLPDTEESKALSLAGVLVGNIVLVIWLSKETMDTFTYLNKLGKINVWVMENISNLSLSAIWAVYSIVLLILGIMKRKQPLRLMAIVLFGVTILKVFFVDLSNLDKLYRVFSFLGLGIILLAASFLYQKYKSVILGIVLEDHNKGVSQ